MENLSHDDNSNSDSDDLPAVGVVLQGYRIAQKKKLICAVNSNANENARYFKLQTGGRAREERDSLRGHKNGFRGLKEKCESIQNQGPTKHGRVNLLENRRAHKYQHVIKGESNETDPNEPELERDQTNLAAMAVTGKGVLLERASLEERRQLPSIEHNRRAERSASQPWKSIHASQLGRGDEGTDIGSDGALEVQFTNNKIPPGTSSSDNNDNNSRSNSSSDERPSPLSSGQNNRAAALDSNSPINGGYGIYKPSELNSDINSSLSSPVKKEQQKYPRISSTSKHRESIDAFWRQSLVNEWNDYYSPKKINFSPPKKAHSERQCAPGFPTLYNHEKEDGTVTPKAERDAVRRKKTFQATKHKTAEAFFAEIDQKMTGGRIAGMSKSTGGVKLIWSKKLISTAGRAHWKRTIPKIEKMCNDTDEVEQHHVSIELAEKVIDDEGRLKNVIAHEFCHLANFMISNVKGNPHGKSFKEWYVHGFTYQRLLNISNLTLS